MKEKMYYLNTPCVIKAELENDEVVIETLIGELDVEVSDSYGYHMDNYIEPIEKTIIVNKKYITKEIVDFEKQSITVLREAENKAQLLITQAEKTARRLVEDATLQSEEFTKEANQELKGILNKIKSINGFVPYIDYLNKDIKYVVRNSYSWNKEYNKVIHTFDEFEKYRIDGDEEGGEIPLKAFALEKCKYQEKAVSLKITNDYYGGTNNYTVKMFKTLEEMEEYVKKCLDESDDIRAEGLENLKKWGIAHSLIDNITKEAIDKEAQYKADRIAKLEKELKEAKGE